MQNSTFDIKKFLKGRPLSWSAIYSFEYDPEQWYRNYFLGQRDPASKEMLFGSFIGKKLETDPTFLPEITRYGRMEHPFSVVFNGIPLVGYADMFDDAAFRALDEFKTGKKPWDQKRVDNHGQIDMYLLMNYVTNRIAPEDVAVTLWWLPTKENGDFTISFIDGMKPVPFRTKRTMQQILKFGTRINTTVAKMQEYVRSHA